MAGSVNKVFLMGNLTRDPELRYTPGNTAVAKFGVAVNRRYRTSDGEQREETTFVDCDAWAKTAEVINQYLRKGSPIFIEGRLRLDQWQDQEGNNRSKLKVVVENFQFVDSRGSQSGGQQEGAPAYSGARAGGSSGGSQESDRHEPISDDDIPF